MAETAAARATEQLTEQARKFAKTTEQVAEKVSKNWEEGIENARRAYKRTRDVAEEAIDDTERLIKRRPFESVATTLAIGFLAGTVVGLLIRRK